MLKPALESNEFRVETLRWRDTRLELIDQRKLPARLEYCVCNDAASIASAIRKMVVRGAPAIGVAAAYGVALEARRHPSASPGAYDEAIRIALDLLAESRPTAVNLFWALDQMRRVWQAGREHHVDNLTLAQKLLETALDIHTTDVRVNQEMGRLGAVLLPDHARVLTHCNAGALATAGYGTALGVIRAAVASGKQVHLIANETRPFLQGARLTAWEMMQENIPVTLIIDNTAAYLMRSGKIDAVVVGADRVAANGDVANKIGTYTLAVLAQQHAIPFYVACPISTIDPALANGDNIPIEERDAAEVTGFGECQWAPDGVSVLNPAFDVTPAALVSALITERGVLKKPDKDKLAALLEQADC